MESICWGLTLFVLVHVVNVLGLLLDLYLHLYDILTITQRTWQYPIIGVVIILWQVAGILGLAYHFWGHHV